MGPLIIKAIKFYLFGKLRWLAYLYKGTYSSDLDSIPSFTIFEKLKMQFVTLMY